MLRFPPNGSGTKYGPPSFSCCLIDEATPASKGWYFVGLDARPEARSSTAATSRPASTTAPVATMSSLASDREAGTGKGVPPGPRIPRFVCACWIDHHAHPWISSNIRASSCSRATASRCPTATGHHGAPRRSRSPTASATRWWSRPRCRWAAGARRAASSWRPTPTRRRPTPRPSSGWTSRATSSRWSGSSGPATSPRSTTRRSRSTGAPSCTSACCRRRVASRSSRWRRRTPTPSPVSTSTRSTGSPRRSAGSGWRRRS